MRRQLNRYWRTNGINIDRLFHVPLVFIKETKDRKHQRRQRGRKLQHTVGTIVNYYKLYGEWHSDISKKTKQHQ